MGFIFCCMLSAMQLLDMQYYISVENAVILFTEISCRIMKLYLFSYFPWYWFCPTYKISEYWKFPVYYLETFLLLSFSLVTQLFQAVLLFSLQCWIIPIYPSNLLELFCCYLNISIFLLLKCCSYFSLALLALKFVHHSLCFSCL